MAWGVGHPASYGVRFFGIILGQTIGRPGEGETRRDANCTNSTNGSAEWIGRAVPSRLRGALFEEALFQKQSIISVNAVLLARGRSRETPRVCQQRSRCGRLDACHGWMIRFCHASHRKVAG